MQLLALTNCSQLPWLPLFQFGWIYVFKRGALPIVWKLSQSFYCCTITSVN